MLDDRSESRVWNWIPNLHLIGTKLPMIYKYDIVCDKYPCKCTYY